MTSRPIAALGLLLACTAAWAAPQSWKPGEKPKSPPAAARPAQPARAKADTAATRPVRYYNSMQDTGQFLADTAVVGRIDDRVFRVREFRERWYTAYIGDRPKPDSAGRLQFLNSMVNKEVLAALAKQVNRPLGFEDRQVLRETRERMLSNAVFARFVADSVVVTRADVQRVYDQTTFQLHLQRIITDHPGTAEQAHADVVSGRLAWSAAVKKHSREPDGDGDMGWKARSDFAPGPALDIFDLKDGQVSRVFQDFDGWQFVRVVARRPSAKVEFDVVARALAGEVREVKLSRRVEQVRQRVRERIGMVYDTTNVDWASRLFAENERQSAAASAAAGNTVLDLSGSLPVFTPADTGRVLARWKDGHFTLDQFLHEYSEIPPHQREKIGAFSAFRSTLDRFIFDPYLAQMGLEAHLDRDTIVTSALARREEQLRVEHLFSDSIESRLYVTPEERRAYYEAHLPDYMTWQVVTFAAIVRPTKEAADSLARRLMAGESAAAVLRADSLAGRVTGSVRTMREDERGQHYYALLFEEMRPGGVQVAGPDKQGEWLVMQKLRHDAGRTLSFEEVQGLVDESVHNLRAEAALQQFLDRHRPKHRVELYAEKLPRIRLTDPAME